MSRERAATGNRVATSDPRVKAELLDLVYATTFVVLAALVIFLNLLSDISYCYLDPRIKMGKSAGD